MNIVILDGLTANPGDLSWSGIESCGELTIYERTSSQDLIARCAGAEAVFTNKVVFTAEHFNALPQLRYIGVLATGTNVIDLKAAQSHGITVCNVPAYSVDSVAQLVMAFVLHFASGVAVHDESVHAGDWVSSPDFCFTRGSLMELSGKTMGIIGLGSIGFRVAQMAQAFGMNILGNSRQPKNFAGIRDVGLEEIYSESDIISLHCPLTPQTENLICRTSLHKMKPSAYLINTGRGGLVNEEDLANALNSGSIAGAGLDVLSSEPPKANNPLLTAKNCAITPHIAWATREARGRLIAVATENLKAFLAGHAQNVVQA